MFETCVVEAWTGEQLLGRAPKLERLLGLGGGCEARPVGHHVEAGHGLSHEHDADEGDPTQQHRDEVGHPPAPPLEDE